MPIRVGISHVVYFNMVKRCAPVFRGFDWIKGGVFPSCGFIFPEVAIEVLHLDGVIIDIYGYDTEYAVSVGIFIPVFQYRVCKAHNFLQNGLLIDVRFNFPLRIRLVRCATEP